VSAPVLEPFVDGAIGVPAPPLRAFVHRYTGYWIDGVGPGTHQGLPSHSLTMVLSLGPPVDLTVFPDGTQRAESFDALVGGLHATPVTIAYAQSQRGVQLDLTPLGARALFGMPARQLASTVVPLAALLGRRADSWLDRLRSASTWIERFAVLDDVLVAALLDTPLPSPEVARAWDRLVATGGGIEVSTLAADVGWSRRHLSERFQQEFGLPPTVAGRVVRFERARRLLERAARPGLADVAAACGYYDQAHLTREFRELAGMTPTAWLAEQLPSVQDELDRVGA
jgi:AraC-like DNA-binding protein